MNIAQPRNYAHFHNAPFVRWRRQATSRRPSASDAPADDIYDNKPKVWEYFVEGAADLMMENLNNPRRLVDGLLASTTTSASQAKKFTHPQTRPTAAAATPSSPSGNRRRPSSCASAARRRRYYWHEVLLPYPRGELAATTDSTDKLVVLTRDEVEITGAAAATHGVLPRPLLSQKCTVCLRT